MDNLLIFAIFVAVLAILLIKDRKNVKREGIVLIRRTKKGVSFIDSVANRFPRFLGALYTVGVVVAIGGMFFASYFILTSAVSVASGGVEGVKLVLPGPVDNAVSAPAVLFMPWYFWVIGIMALIIPHEFSHGVVSRLRKIKVKTVGWILLIVIPGAFVEPDEKQLKASTTGTKLRVYAAGSFANFIMAFLFFGIMLLYVPATLNNVGVIPSYLESGLPMAEMNATGAILSINGEKILSQDILSNMMSSIPAGTEINVETSSGNYTIKTVPHELRDGSRIGVIGPYVEYKEIKSEFADTPLEPAIFFFGQLFDWIILLNLGVGLVNLLPIKPLDGGLMMEAIVEKFSGKNRRTKIIVKVITIVFLLTLLYSVFGALI